jgi:sec-independent protein translocase protein TatB
MFDIGWGELVLIGLVALIVIGPKELPTVLRTAGQWMGKVRRMASEFQGQFQEALREAEVADLKQQADDISGSLKSITEYDPLAEAAKEEAGAEEWGETFEPTEHTPAAETTAESETAAIAAESTVDVEPAPAAPVAAVESAPIASEDLTSAETPPPKQAGGSA